MDKGTKSRRKVRTDRNHVIYLITCLVTGETYIGITAMPTRSVAYALKRRWQKHMHHAFTELRPYLLHEAFRAHGAENFTIELLEKVRGKADAHAREKVLITEMEPELNVECTSKKKRPAKAK
jgi:group I intron endonuclease